MVNYHVSLLALWGEGDVINGNVATLFRPHGCLDCQGESFGRVGEPDVDSFPDVLVDPVHRWCLPKLVLVTLGKFQYRQLPVLHSVHVVKEPHKASHLVQIMMVKRQ